MKEKSVIKTIRFNEADSKKIEQFLKENPGMEFSTLIRIALHNFIENPKLNFIAKPKATKGKTLWN